MPALGAAGVKLQPGWPPASSTTTEKAVTTAAEDAIPRWEAGAINATEVALKYTPEAATPTESAAGAGDNGTVLKPLGEVRESSRASYQGLPSSEEEVKALRAAVSTLQADMSALKGPPKLKRSSVDNLEEDPPLLQLCLGGGCIQKTSAELSGSVYFISLLRVVSLLKMTSPDCRSSEAPANARPRLAAAGWATLLFIAAMLQIFLMVLILETSTSSTCNVEHQTGCRDGEYCSESIAKGQCNDCSVILPNTTTCCPTLDTFCPGVDYGPNDTYFAPTNVTDPLCKSTDGGDGCPHVCTMYQHCMSQESNEHYLRRCDFLVNGRNGVKWSHIFLLTFGAVLWTSDLISVLDETDMIAATLPEAATSGERSAHNAIVMLFKFIFVLRTCALPALSAAGAIVAILTDNDGKSLTGGAPATVEPEII